MAIEFEQSFVVKAAPDAVWEYLTDPFRIGAALPGATVTEKVDEKTYAGTITVKVGPVSTKYKGTAVFEKLDAASRTAEITASGRDVKGRGGVDMKMTSRVVERAPGETEVSVLSEVRVVGILAQLGRGMIQEVSDQLFRKFTDAVRAELEQGPAAGGDAKPGEPAAAPARKAEALDAVALGTAVAGGMARRWLRQPAFWVALAAVVAVVLWLSM